QEYFILHFGPDVNLGNIQPRDVLGVEALRAGLRFETLQPLVEQMEREGAADIPTLAERISRMARRRLPEA
ncbi:MAG TPA: phosphosulfolactate synthase, partial [Anaerolineae bacterium]|nr:phosphosulfolactate synthase [Anaerolineae bacterium]